MPILFIITGSNGAGKSTIGYNYLPQHLQNISIFDGDKLFMQKKSEFWRSGIKSYKECKRLAFAYVEETFDLLVEKALIDKTDFVYEGHFTNEATWDIPRRFKANGYSINLIFFGLTDTNLSQLRVIDRAKEGGHYVDPLTLTSNFYGNLEKLNQHYAMFDSVQIVDTSEVVHKLLAIFQHGLPVNSVEVADLPEWFQKNLPELKKRILKKDEYS
ncbi:MAG: zeta toxin family protein [Chitinophagaceae bacterium]|jgi:predicted ABC-type ATPase|nr:zeta toxin family protein [Chitinophagaceae bacterium]